MELVFEAVGVTYVQRCRLCGVVQRSKITRIWCKEKGCCGLMSPVLEYEEVPTND